MAVEITVILDGTAGGMTRVITALRRAGLRFSGHHIEAVGDDRSRLTVNADGTAAAGELREMLAGVKGVAEVVRIGTDDSAPGEPAPVPVVNAAGLDEFADRLVNEYPRILRHIDAFEQALPRDQDLGQQLRELGWLVGGKLGAQDSALQEAGTLKAALEESVVPILDRIAEPEVVGDSDIRVRLSIFTRRQVNTMDLVFGGEASRCDFLSGMIEGMVAKAPAVADVKVEETSCRTNGDEYCLFRVKS
ncbi:MAG TPA: V4R domain-containing protein [Arenicellales bacterium]|nr:V4R domain-containing protein [Arenicellales bacterium]